jgi:hypothetical protein
MKVIMEETGKECFGLGHGGEEEGGGNGFGGYGDELWRKGAGGGFGFTALHRSSVHHS